MIIFKGLSVAKNCLRLERLWHKCFLVKFEKFLKTSFLQNNSGRLLLSNILLYIRNIFTQTDTYVCCYEMHVPSRISPQNQLGREWSVGVSCRMRKMHLEFEKYWYFLVEKDRSFSFCVYEKNLFGQSSEDSNVNLSFFVPSYFPS